MRRRRDASAAASAVRLGPDAVRRHFDRPEVAAVHRFGSTAHISPHPLSDIDLAYLGTDGEAEERVFDVLHEGLQRELGEGNFDLLPRQGGL